MRTLTIGVLIVSGGTLAALPFRRTKPLPDASASPTEVTGPTRTALDSPPRLASRADAEAPFVGQRSDWESDWNSGPLGWSDGKSSDRSRNLEMPLTYDDLASAEFSAPIDRPAAIDANFGALVQNQPRQSPSGIFPRQESQAPDFTAARQPIASASKAQQRMEPQQRFGSAQRLETESPSDPIPRSVSEPMPSTVFAMPATDSPAAGGSLTSSRLEQLPRPDAVVSQPVEIQTEPARRARHWIRQPDF